jgi:hypothetical protein
MVRETCGKSEVPLASPSTHHSPLNFVSWKKFMSLSKSVFALGLVRLLTVPAWADSGLEFPHNDQVPDGQTVRFKFTNPHTNGLPIYGPSGTGVTYIWKI